MLAEGIFPFLLRCEAVELSVVSKEMNSLFRIFHKLVQKPLWSNSNGRITIRFKKSSKTTSFRVDKIEHMISDPEKPIKLLSLPKDKCLYIIRLSSGMRQKHIVLDLIDMSNYLDEYRFYRNNRNLLAKRKAQEKAEIDEEIRLEAEIHRQRIIKEQQEAEIRRRTVFLVKGSTSVTNPWSKK